MAEGYKNWAAGDTLTSANLEDYTVLQSAMRFVNAAARDSDLSAAKQPGMLAFLHDTDVLTIYTGSAWSTIGPVYGALTSWTPAVVQSGSVTVTVTYARYMRVGRMVQGWFSLSCTGSGTGSNPVTISTPVTAATSGIVVGTGVIFDATATTHYTGNLFLGSTSVFDIRQPSSATDNRLGNTGFTAALASSDLINGSFQFEAAGDA